MVKHYLYVLQYDLRGQDAFFQTDLKSNIPAYQMFDRILSRPWFYCCRPPPVDSSYRTLGQECAYNGGSHSIEYCICKKVYAQERFQCQQKPWDELFLNYGVEKWRLVLKDAQLYHKCAVIDILLTHLPYQYICPSFLSLTSTGIKVFCIKTDANEQRLRVF